MKEQGKMIKCLKNVIDVMKHDDKLTDMINYSNVMLMNRYASTKWKRGSVETVILCTIILAPQSQSEIAGNKCIATHRGGVSGIVFN